MYPPLVPTYGVCQRISVTLVFGPASLVSKPKGLVRNSHITFAPDRGRRAWFACTAAVGVSPLYTVLNTNELSVVCQSALDIFSWVIVVGSSDDEVFDIIFLISIPFNSSIKASLTAFQNAPDSPLTTVFW